MLSETKSRLQRQKIMEYLKENTATASMTVTATGVPHKVFTRRKSELEKAGKLWQLIRKPCKETGFYAWWLTCNENLLPSKQPDLFAEGE